MQTIYKKSNTMKITKLFLMLTIVAALFNACKKEENPISKEGIERSEIIFTEVSGTDVEAHGDHFHGLANAVEGAKTTVKFDDKGVATANGHLHLEADAIYKLELKAWDYTGKEVQNDFIASKAVADNFKAFIVGGNFILNANSTSESGAIFQPRELKHTDGTDVTGAGGIGTTGVLGYFTIGHDNEGATKNVSYVLRKVNTGVKATITRNDWNLTDYASKFAGQDVLKLNFEIHAGHH
jgi:hypothetical protein